MTPNLNDESKEWQSEFDSRFGLRLHLDCADDLSYTTHSAVFRLLLLHVIPSMKTWTRSESYSHGFSEVRTGKRQHHSDAYY
jgi:hypothetical protein